MGAAGFWNDMNEPAVFRYPQKTMADRRRHRRKTDHALINAAVTNIFRHGKMPARLRRLAPKLQPDERPFAATRAAMPALNVRATCERATNSATGNQPSMSTR